MAQPTPDQVQIANEVLAGTREITGSNTVSIDDKLSDADKQKVADITAALEPTMKPPTPTPEPAQEMGPLVPATLDPGMADHIQKLNDVKAPGE